MAMVPSLSSQLRNMKVDRSPIPPRTWESIPSESGEARSADPTQKCQDPIYDSFCISEAAVVRLVVNALLGVKSSLMQINLLSAELLSSPADRSFHRVPTLWCRSLSTNALGKILKCISHSGLLVFFLQRFVDFYLCRSQEINAGNADAEEESNSQGRSTSGNFYDENEMWLHPPYSLVNQSFAVAVKKVLQGYFGSLSTLIASVKLRRSEKSFNEHAHISDGAGSPMRIVDSGITVLEVFLHTKELRTCIESLANICFPRFADLALSREDLTADTKLEFRNFPRGADLLSYLYVQLRDADPVHRALLKLLFIGACEPYCAFIKSWIYRASIDDPYKEFFVYNSNQSSNMAVSVDNLALKADKEQDDIIVPCFLRDVRVPLLRAGQQLRVLVKLLNLSNLAFIGGRADMTCNLANLDEVLPFWVPSDRRDSFNSLSFSKQRIQFVMNRRQIMYEMMLEKLNVLFKKLDDRFQHFNESVIHFGNASNFLGKSGDQNISFYLDSDGFLFSATDDTQEANKINTSQKDTDVSYTSDEFSCNEEPPQTSDYSSSYYSEEENELEKLHLLSEDFSQPELSAISSLSAWGGSKTLLPICTVKGRLSSQVPSQATSKQFLSIPSLTEQHNVDQSLNRSSAPNDSGDVTIIPVTIANNYQPHYCWPLGGLLKNPFNSIGIRGPTQQQLTENGIITSNESSEVMQNAKSIFGEPLISYDSKLDLISKINLMDATNESCSLGTYQPYDLSANPMLTKASWLSNKDSSKIITSMKDHRSHLPYYDFSSVQNPSTNFSDSICSHSLHGCHLGTAVHVESDPSALSMNKILASPVQDHIANQSVSDPLYSSPDLPSMPENFSSGVVGGASWAGSLRCFSEYIRSSSGDMRHDPSAEFEVPLEAVIDKCILQEILLQYKYISNFTIKLLEGFDLHEHLLALRRYHFMELADWADSFILSLRNQKWYSIELEKKVAEIQGLLELALQRSSCEADHYKERLFVYVKGQNTLPLSTCAAGIQLFDLMSLGYRVNWPISIIVTPEALKIYAEIFDYLIQLRLAAISLSDIWHYIKKFMRSLPHRENRRVEQTKQFNILIKLRQQMNHFVSALQQYVHSQLSDVSWFGFQYSLKHQVKDISDIESLHMSYLAEALDICFLSDETKSVAVIMRNILQCSLDFWQCFSEENLYAEASASNMRSYINFAKVFDIKDTFERNLKNLYLLYLKSPKHHEYSICRFWRLLDYNEYYSTIFNKDMGYL